MNIKSFLHKHLIFVSESLASSPSSDFFFFNTVRSDFISTISTFIDSPRFRFIVFVSRFAFASLAAPLGSSLGT